MSISFTSIPACKDTQPFAECRGVDLSRELRGEDVDDIKAALLKHGLLLFRNQHELTPAREVAFSEAFGWHDATQELFLFGFGAPSTEHKVSGGAQLPRWPQVSILGNVLLNDYFGVQNTQLVPRLGLTYSGWHADGLHDMFDGLPELTTMSNPVGYRVTSGGETYFTSGVRAVERMDQELAQELSRCVAAYVRCPNDDAPDESRNIAPGPAFMVDDGARRVGFARDVNDPDAGLIEDFTLSPEHADDAGRHRCIHVHPVTGQSSLYVTPSRAVYLLDAETGEIRHDIEETSKLLGDALHRSVVPGVRYEHQWREGDFVAWINTLVLHTATDASGITGERLLHRVRLSTPKTRWVDGSYLSF